MAQALLIGLTRRGWKAPWYTKDKDWIEKNVGDPFEYVRIDSDTLRLDLLEWGVPPQDFWNLHRLTPAVFRFRDATEDEWIIKYSQRHDQQIDESIARYCLDLAVSLISAKQRYLDLSKALSRGRTDGFKVKVTETSPLLSRTSRESTLNVQVEEGKILNAEFFCQGFDGEDYFKILHIEGPLGAPESYLGYLPLSACERIAIDED